MRISPTVLLLPAVLCWLSTPGETSASGKRDENLLISFHLETSKEEWPKFAQAIKMGDPAQQYYFKLAPEITDRDVVWFFPFISEDGTTYGTAFKLNAGGAQRLLTLSNLPENHGKLLAVNVQPISSQTGPVRGYLQIDRRISDGVVVIWTGLTDAHLQIFSQRYAHVRDFMPQ